MKRIYLPSEVYAVLTLCQRLSPDGKVQSAFTRLSNEMIRAGPTEDLSWEQQQFLTLLGALTDGIRYGNWPGVEMPKPEEIEPEATGSTE